MSLQPLVGTKVLVNVSSDVKPQQIYLFDTQTRKLSHELDTRPQMGEGDLQPMHPFLLKTRDGLEIPGHVLPKGWGGRAAPAHPGAHPRRAHARADFRPGRDWRARGPGARVARLRGGDPHFRITPGMGRKIYMSASAPSARRCPRIMKTRWQWAVKAGFADPAARVHRRLELRRLRDLAAPDQDA